MLCGCTARKPETNPETMALYQLRYKVTMRFTVSKMCEIIQI